jgi:multidomain signaling protein FimX
MSGSHSPKAPIRVLVAEESEETVTRIDSILRDAGYATRMLRSADADSTMQSFIDNECDIAFLSVDQPEVDTLLPRLRKASRTIPIILCSTEHSRWTTGEAMTLGASDLVALRDEEHLGHVAQREIEHVCQRARASVLSRSLKEVEQRCLLLLQGSRAPIAYIHEGLHVYANPAYLHFFGCADVDDMLGVSMMDFLSPTSAADFKEQMKVLRNSTEEVRFPFTATTTDDKPVEGILVLANSSYEGEACLQATLLPLHSVPIATAPPPTDFLDLGSFLKLCEDRHSTSSEGQSFMFLACVEGLEKIRSELGLLRADKIADQVFELVQTASEDAPVLRLSQNEFTIAQVGTDRATAFNWANSLQRELAKQNFELAGKNIPVTISLCGVRIAADVEHALDAVYQQLHDLIAANRTSTITLESETPVVSPVVLDEAGKMVARITEAIETQSFRLLYQPIISLRGDNDEHYEVFLRMIDSEGHEHVPDQFLRTAIEHGVAAKMDRWVILQSIKALCIHRAKGHNTRLTINVTSNSVADAEFIKWLTVAIKAARLPSDAVIFQITEKDAVTFRKETADFVLGLKRMHCQAAIGRFGLVTTPFELLDVVAVDIVKIDGSLIRTLGQRGDLITPMLKKLQSLGKFTIVPMVESAAQLTALWQAGANYIQGHYLQEPRTEMDYDFSVEEED